MATFETLCMADKVYPCPLCGRSVNRQGTPFTDPSQTMSHINGAHDARHTDESGDEHAEEIRENAEELDDVVSQLEETDEDTAENTEMVEAMAAHLEEIEERLTAVEEEVARGPSQREVEELREATRAITETIGGSIEFEEGGEEEGALDNPFYDPTEEFDG